MFAVGLVPALVAVIVRRTVGEPALFTARARLAATPAPRTGGPLRLLIKDWPTTKISFGMFILCSVQNFGYYGLMIWLPSYLSNGLGYSLTRSAVWTAVTVLGMAFGIFLFGQLADRIGRRPIFFVFQAGAALMVVVYAQLTTPTALLIGGGGPGQLVKRLVGGVGRLVTGAYPTAGRADPRKGAVHTGPPHGGV